MPVTRRSVLAGAAAGTGVLALSGWSTAVVGQAPAVEAAAAEGARRLDLLDFGDPDSESVHDLTTDNTAVVDGDAGDKARVARPSTPPTSRAATSASP